ncbi:P-II family nitrogen regulator [Agaribacter flavus]|uniref:P-II family nitrogen regulator n=1 Tax=Agaribacter flavus TaxID=1902781 RepID=A0ABV7FNM9_9ALTE
MKKIEAIIKPHKLDEVRKALSDAGFYGLTATEVNGYGRQKGHAETYRGAEYKVEFLPKIKLEIATTDEHADRCIEVILASASTGIIGDGKIFVTKLNHVMRIRTQEVDDEAV